jgi:hypothetical protein
MLTTGESFVEANVMLVIASILVPPLFYYSYKWLKIFWFLYPSKIRAAFILAICCILISTNIVRIFTHALPLWLLIIVTCFILLPLLYLSFWCIHNISIFIIKRLKGTVPIADEI